MRRQGRSGLLGVELHDELLLDGLVDVLAQGQREHLDLEAVPHRLEPRRERTVERVHVAADVEELPRGRLEGDGVALAEAVAGDGDPLAVDQHVAVADELAGLGAAGSPPGPEGHVVEPELEHDQQVLTGDARSPAGLDVEVVELLLEQSVDAACLLLLAQLAQVFRPLAHAVAAVLAGRVGPAVAVGDRLGDGALHGIAALALQEELGALPAAEPTDGSGVTSHGGPWFPSFPSLHPPPLLGAAAVVRDGGDIFDAGDLDAGGGQRADGGLATGARPADEHVDAAHAVCHGPLCALLGGELGGERRGLAGALEPDVAGRRPGEDIALRIGDGDARVVERALDVGDAEGDVLPLALAGPTGGSRLGGLGHYLRTFFLPATVFFGPLRVRALVWVRWPWTGRPLRWRIPW